MSVAALSCMAANSSNAQAAPAKPIVAKQITHPKAQAAGIWGAIKLIISGGRKAVQVVLGGVKAVIRAGQKVYNAAGKLIGVIDDSSSLAGAAQEARKAGCHEFHAKLICPRVTEHMKKVQR